MEQDHPLVRDLWLARFAKGLPGRLTVRSGSMRPLLELGETIEVVPLRGLLLPADLVVFRQGERLVCHRLMLPVAPGLFLQKGDFNREWEHLRRRDILGRPRRILAADRVIALHGPRFRLLNGLVWILVGLRDLVRLPGQFIRPLAGVGEVLFSRLIGGIMAEIRKEDPASD